MHQDGLFSGDAENVIRWVKGAGIAVTLIAVAVLGIALARGIAWRNTPAARWSFLVGLFLLPLVSMVLANVAGFHHVKQSCADCHVMAPWIEDMKNPDSTTLAAKHHQNRWINEDACYTCHTGYGLAGNLKAKWNGMKHVWHYYSGTVPETIRIRKPFPVATCLHCHADAAGFRKIDQHVDPEMRPKIFSGELSCFECHEAPHPRKTP